MVEPGPATASNGGLSLGEFFTGLTRDDAGGLRYLLNKTNVAYEQLSAEAQRVSVHEGLRMNRELRPGVEKVTFVQHPFRPSRGKFLPMEIRYGDARIRDGAAQREHTVRLVAQPDFLFCAADTGTGNWWTPFTVSTDTSDWVNNAALNGGATNGGPGVIQPPIRITFHKLGALVGTWDNNPPELSPRSWGSFASSTDEPVVYPDGIESKQGRLTLRFRFWNSLTLVQNQTWELPVPAGKPVALQISTNQTDWTTTATVTNTGAVIEWYHCGTTNSPKFFRAVPE